MKKSLRTLSIVYAPAFAVVLFYSNMSVLYPIRRNPSNAGPFKQWGQYSRSTERMVLEHGRRRRPGRLERQQRLCLCLHGTIAPTDLKVEGFCPPDSVPLTPAKGLLPLATPLWQHLTPASNESLQKS